MTKAKILEVLKQIIDPELGINIVDLGLIYQIDFDKKNAVGIVMTLTNPFCPMKRYFIDQIKNKLSALDFNKIDLEFSFDPVWTPQMMSSTLKKDLEKKRNPEKINKKP